METEGGAKMKRLPLAVFSLLPLVFTTLKGQDGNASVTLKDLNTSTLDQQDISQKPPQRSTIQATLDEASRMLNSSKLEERIGAAKLLGKYPRYEASLLLIGGLDDSSALVRRAALVSLVEHFNNGSPVYEKPLVEKIFSKIGDSDVEIRREASALIPRLAPGLMRSGMEKVQLNGRTVFRSLPGRLRADLQLLVEEGFLDRDSIVRQNLLKYHFSLRIQIKPQTFCRLLEDEDNAVVLVALDQARMYAMLPGVYERMNALTQHKDSGVRSKLAKSALELGRAFPDYRKILRSLTKDQEDVIATVAAVDLARLGELVSPGMVNRIIDYLMGSRGLYGRAETLFFSLSALGKDGARIYKTLTDHASASMRAKAWERHIVVSEAWGNPVLWMPSLLDRDSQVRKSVLSVLRGRVEKINASDLVSLIHNPNAEVRVFAAELLLVAEEDVVEESFFDLLIDQDSLVRSTTLRALANRKSEGWLHLHTRSLRDDDYGIQRAAMDGLLSDREEGVPALLSFIKSHPTKPISSLARKELERMGMKP